MTTKPFGFSRISFLVFCILYLRARARTTKPFGFSRIFFLYLHIVFARQSEDDEALWDFENQFFVFFNFFLRRPGYLSCYISIAAAFSTVGAVSAFSSYSFPHHLKTVICILHCCFSFIVKLDSSNDSEACGLLWSVCYISIVDAFASFQKQQIDQTTCCQ